MSLLVEIETVAVKMMEGTSLAVNDLSSPSFPYQALKGTAASFIFDLGRPH